MAIELKLQLKMSQQLLMTPHLQQAIKLLQLNRLELLTEVRQELNENPVLEEIEGNDEPTPAEIADMTPGEERAEGEAPNADPAAVELEGLPDDFLKTLDGDTGEAGADATSESSPAADVLADAAARRPKPRPPQPMPKPRTRRRSPTSSGTTTWTPIRRPVWRRTTAKTNSNGCWKPP